MTLALLLTAATGAWAITDPNAVYWDKQTWAGWEENVTTHTVGDITITAIGSGKVYQSESSNEPLALQAGANDAITFTSNGKPFASVAIITDDELNVAGWTYNSSTWSYEWSGEPTTSVTLSGCDIKADYITFTFGTAEAPITVEPGSSANTWTFAMPASDVVLTPVYAEATILNGQTEKQAYASLKEAFAAVQEGDIIKLDWDVTLHEQLTTPERNGDPIHFMLDFNGYTITDGSGMAGYNCIELRNGDVMFLTDESKDKNGGLKGMVAGLQGSRIVFVGGRYDFGEELAATNIKNMWVDHFALDLGWSIVLGKEFIDLNNGSADDDGFFVCVDFKTIELTIDSKRFATFYSDMNIKFAEKPAEGVGLYTISSIDADRSTATVTPISGIIPAGTPMLVYNGTEQEQTAKLIVTLDNAQNAITWAPEFKGTAIDLEFTADAMAAADYYALSGGKAFAPVKGAGTLGANQCWLQFDKQEIPSARQFTLVFDSEATGIKTTDCTDYTDSVWYDLNGRKVAAPSKKGIYIMNGRKVVK